MSELIATPQQSPSGIGIADSEAPLARNATNVDSPHRGWLRGLQATRFGLFILLNGLLFIPTDISPCLYRVPIVELVLVADVMMAWLLVVKQLRWNVLTDRPITACVIGIFIAIVLSRLSHFDARGAVAAGIRFEKVLLYFLLLVALTDTLRKLKTLLWCIALFGTIHAGLAILEYRGVVDIPAMAKLVEVDVDRATGEVEIQTRLQGAGIFNDPNDLSLLLVTTIMISLVAISERQWRWHRLAAFLPLLICGYALMLTKSRGGFLSLVVGMMCFCYARFGLRRSMQIGAVAVPVLLLLFAGRQTQFHILHSTGQSRIRLWGKGLWLFARSPIFGIGQGRYCELAGQVAHNSFLHCFTELGFIGGMCFLGAFFLALRPLLPLRRADECQSDFQRLRPVLLAMVAAYIAGIISLSRAHVAPTYAVLGVSAAYLQMAEAQSSMLRQRLDLRLILRLAGLGIAFLIVMAGFVGMFLRVK